MRLWLRVIRSRSMSVPATNHMPGFLVFPCINRGSTPVQLRLLIIGSMPVPTIRKILGNLVLLCILRGSTRVRLMRTRYSGFSGAPMSRTGLHPRRTTRLRLRRRQVDSFASPEKRAWRQRFSPRHLRTPARLRVRGLAPQKPSADRGSSKGTRSKDWFNRPGKGQ